MIHTYKLTSIIRLKMTRESITSLYAVILCPDFDLLALIRTYVL